MRFNKTHWLGNQLHPDKRRYPFSHSKHGRPSPIISAWSLMIISNSNFLKPIQPTSSSSKKSVRLINLKFLSRLRRLLSLSSIMGALPHKYWGHLLSKSMTLSSTNYPEVRMLLELKPTLQWRRSVVFLGVQATSWLSKKTHLRLSITSLNWTLFLLLLFLRKARL
mgnify:FL=1